MPFAIATLVLWTLSAYGSSRCARVWGSARANRYRLGTAVLVLALIQLVAIGEWLPPGLWWFLLGGVCHLGLGDIALYGTYRTIGPRLGVLITLCLAAPLALLAEWLWLGTTLPPARLALMGLIVIAVIVALAPTERLRLGPAAIRAGVACGCLAAVGQACGAVVTRMGYQVAAAAEATPHAFTGALLRTAGGLGALLVARGLTSLWRPVDVPAAYSDSSAKAGAQAARQVWPWLVVAALIGPVIGIAAYQKALELLPAAQVQATLVCLPVTMIPLAWFMDHDRPSLRSLLGGLVAVGAVIALLLTSADVSPPPPPLPGNDLP